MATMVREVLTSEEAAYFYLVNTESSKGMQLYVWLIRVGLKIECSCDMFYTINEFSAIIAGLFDKESNFKEKLGFNSSDEFYNIILTFKHCTIVIKEDEATVEKISQKFAEEEEKRKERGMLYFVIGQTGEENEITERKIVRAYTEREAVNKYRKTLGWYGYRTSLEILAMASETQIIK